MGDHRVKNILKMSYVPILYFMLSEILFIRHKIS